METMRGMRPWQWVLVGVGVLVVIGALSGEQDDGSSTKTQTVTVTRTVTHEAEVPAHTAEQRADTLSDARAAVDVDQYSRALVIASALGRDEEGAIRQRISNRLARRALAALSSGNRARAGSLLRSADRYPTTQQLTRARASYRTANERAAQRAQERRDAQRRREQAERAAQEAESGSGGCDPNYSGCVPRYPPDVNCPEVDGPVQVLGSDPHGLDRDRDGIACE